MDYDTSNRFQEFFEEDRYVFLKNYLYNYLLRKMAVGKSLRKEKPELVLEVGSGISPVMTRTGRIVYSDVSLTAVRILRRTCGRGHYVVADGVNLPFKQGVFSHTICSEVLEHLGNDRHALQELARVMKPSGRLIVTFPHKKLYFTVDDHFVNHFRRYELREMKALLRAVGLEPVYIRKVLGPLEKLTMCVAIFCFSKIRRPEAKEKGETRRHEGMDMFALLFEWFNRLYAGVVWLDAVVMPRALSTVLLMKAEKTDIWPSGDIRDDRY